MLTLEGLRYTDGAFMLRADLTVPAGRRVAVIGPSGAGKSTLLDLIAGFRTPDAGKVRIAGQDVTALPPGQRPVAMLFQDNNLFPHLTLAQNLALALRPRGGRPDAAERARIVAVLAQVGLKGMEARRPGSLSGGQQSRAALARLILQARPLILLDEPFAALGPALRAEMAGLMRQAVDAAGATALMVTHDMADARAFADDAILVAEGMAHPPVALEPLLKDPPPALRAYLGG